MTPTLPAPAAAKTVSGEEKVAGDLPSKAAKVAAGIQALAKTLSKKAEVTQPNMPPNDAKNEGTDGGANKPPSGGAGAKNNPDPAVKDAAPSAPAAGATPADKTEDGKAKMPAADSKGELPADKTNADTKAAGEGKCAKCGKMEKECGCGKSAAADTEIPLDTTFHLKLASIILSTEEGRAFAQQQIEKEHGRQAAADIVKAAALMEQKAEELAQAEESGALIAEEMWKAASAEEQQVIIKLAQVLTVGRESYRTEHEKLAYDAGANAAAQMGDAGMLGQEAPQGMDESIMAALDEMVQSGELTPELAAQILEALQGGGAGGAGGAPMGAEGGMPPEGGEGGEPPAGGGGGRKAPKEDEGGEEEKEARTKSASNLAAVCKILAAPAPAAKTA